MIPILLAIAAAALYFLPLIVPKPPPPDDIALPPVPGGPTPQQQAARVLPPLPRVPSPAGPDFVSAVKAVDAVVAYLRSTGQYAGPQVDAARVLRAAVVEGATPGPPPDHFAGVSKMAEASA